jgi:hypothetical protein
VIKNAQQSANEDGATATMAATPTKEGRRRCGTGQGNNEEEETIGELAIVASMPPIQKMQLRQQHIIPHHAGQGGQVGTHTEGG